MPGFSTTPCQVHRICLDYKGRMKPVFQDNQRQAEEREKKRDRERTVTL